MQVRHLEIFHAVMLTGTITAAARLLNIAQPAATRLLLRAEAQLGYKLFERHNGRLTPTDRAKILHAGSERIISSLDNLRKVSRTLASAASGAIRVAAAPALCIDLLPRAIARFRQKHPDVHFHVETRQYADLVRVVLNRNVDIGIGFDIQPHPSLDLTTLAEANFYAIFPQHMARDLPPVVGLDVFSRLPFIGLRTDNPLGSTTATALKLADLNLNPIVEVKTNMIALSLVSEGAGAAIIDQYTAASHDPERVAIRRLTPSLGLTVHAMRLRHHAPALPTRRFTAVVGDVEREISNSIMEIVGSTPQKLAHKG